MPLIAAKNSWREYYNPLRGLTMARVVSMPAFAEGYGGSARGRGTNKTCNAPCVASQDRSRVVLAPSASAMTLRHLISS
jgi:hypothetical protein